MNQLLWLHHLQNLQNNLLLGMLFLQDYLVLDLLEEYYLFHLHFHLVNLLGFLLNLHLQIHLIYLHY